jgi:glycerophosphoryl diester phosphodiesterase
VILLIHALALLTLAGPSPELIAHRGESYDAPENTMAAFHLAWKRNVKAIELDVHLTKDGQLVICHDKDTNRTTGREFVIKESRLEQLRPLDAGRWKDERWSGEKMPTLAEALATIPNGARCFIEIKVGPEAVPATVKAIRECAKSPKQLAIISFKAETVAEAKRRLPEIDAYFLADFKQDKETGAWSPSVDELIQQAKQVRADGLDLSYKGPVDRAFVKRIKEAGLKCYVWTVDEPAIARQFADWGVDGITTNRAAWMATQLEASAPAAR